MRIHKSLRLQVLAFIFSVISLLAATSAAAQSIKIEHSFDNNGKDGYYPWASLIRDSSGNLYGTTTLGGTHNNGAVFELLPKTGGGWTEKILYSFDYDGTGGSNPDAGLVRDAAGNLYGTTTAGGVGTCEQQNAVVGCGIVYKLTPSANGNYTERILYEFKNNQRDGYFPFGGLILDSAGNLYGTTIAGGAGVSHYGTVYELSPPAAGKTAWTETILWNFNNTDGSSPRAPMVFDSAGNLYGTTQNGGAHKYGTVFELTPSSSGTWTETVLHSFNNSATELAYPVAGLIFDAAGNLYSTASYGGQSGGGGVFELSPSTGGTWTETILHSFNYADNSDGYNPWAPLIFDSAGNLYGTTSDGGSGGCEQIGLVIGCGTIFKLSPSGGTWTESIVYNFDFTSNNNPEGPEAAGLISDGSGNFYGMTYGGGTNTEGTVFLFKP